MPSRKGKGRQSLGFGSKSQRAQFHHEWQARLYEDYYSVKKRQQQRQQAQRTSTSSQKIRISQRPPRVQNSLRRLIAERQHWDRIEDRSWIYGQQQKRLAAAEEQGKIQDTSPPGWLLYHGEEEEFGREYNVLEDDSNDKVPSLQALALRALAKALPEYLEELGVEQLHQYLDLLPGPALSVLSVISSKNGNMTDSLCRALGQHSQLTRFSLVACAKCEETDPNWKDLHPNEALRETLLPTRAAAVVEPSEKPLWISTDAVPDSWEELIDSDDEDEEDNETRALPPPPTFWKGCCQLERLELGNLPLLEVEVVRDILQAYGRGLTHLGLSGSLMYYDRGPDVLWQLSEWVPNLQVLDVSGNSKWVTEPVLRSVYESYHALWESRRNNNHTNSSYNSAVLDDDSHSLGTATTTSIMTTSTHRSAGRRQGNHLLIKATGCLTRSSQILMEMEFGTLF